MVRMTPRLLGALMARADNEERSVVQRVRPDIRGYLGGSPLPSTESTN